MNRQTRKNTSESHCLYTIRTLYPKLSAKEREIADYILTNTAEAVNPSIDQLAETIGISQSTLVRFVRKLGFKGYQRFRIALATETLQANSRMYETPVDDSHDIIDLVCTNVQNTLNLTRELVDLHTIQEATRMVTQAKRIFLFGLGGSQIIAQDAFHKFVRIGLDCSVTADYHLQLMLASQTDASCIGIIISHTGSTMDTIAIAEELKERDCPFIVITTSVTSSLARMATLSIGVAGSKTSTISEAFSSRIAQMVVIDILYVTLLESLGNPAVEHLESMRRTIAKRRI